MQLSFRKLHPRFVAEASPIDLRSLVDADQLDQIRAGMDEHGILVFRDQQFTGTEQIAFAQRFDGSLHTKTSTSVLGKNRFGNEALTDISNVDEKNELFSAGDRRRMNSIGNRMWHTDASFENPAGRYSMLFARVIPPVPSNTEYADTRAAYDDLDPDLKERILKLKAYHSIVYSRHVAGFDFAPEEAAKLPGAVHPLVRDIQGAKGSRKSLYLGAHASHIDGWQIPEGRLLIRDLMEHATKPEYVYSHAWKPNDFVIWDNRATIHRGTSFDDTKYQRELTRVTTQDLPRTQAVAA